MNVSVNTIEKLKWVGFFKDNPLSTPFQSPDFFDFINSVKGYEAIVYSIEEQNAVKALCVVTIQKEKGVKGYFSRRAIIYGGPLAVGEKYLTELLKYIYLNLKNKAIFIEVRNYKDYSSFADIYKQQNWEYIPYLNYELSFAEQTLESLVAKMKYNRRREIKMSINAGVTYGEPLHEKEIVDLYNILHELYTTRVQLPLPDLEFFIKLSNSKVGKTFIVRHKEKVIGGSFCVCYENQYIFTMYYCGLRDYNKKIFPTHLAIIAAIEFGVMNKLAGIDLMGAGKPDEDYGVRNYKAEFGGKLVEHGRWLIINNERLYRIGKIALTTAKKLKLKV